MTGMVRKALSRGSAWEDRHVCRKRSALGDIIESGPEAYGLDSGVWTLTDDWSGSRGRGRRHVPSWARAEVAGRNWLLGSMSATSPGSRRRHRPGALATTTSPTLKKIPNRRAGSPPYRGGQLSARLDPPPDLVADRLPAASSGDRTMKAHQDLWSDRGLHGAVSVQP
jgi:hypothetical protein